MACQFLTHCFELRLINDRDYLKVTPSSIQNLYSSKSDNTPPQTILRGILHLDCCSLFVYLTPTSQVTQASRDAPSLHLKSTHHLCCFSLHTSFTHPSDLKVANQSREQPNFEQELFLPSQMTSDHQPCISFANPPASDSISTHQTNPSPWNLYSPNASASPSCHTQ